MQIKIRRFLKNPVPATLITFLVEMEKGLDLQAALDLNQIFFYVPALEAFPGSTECPFSKSQDHLALILSTSLPKSSGFSNLLSPLQGCVLLIGGIFVPCLYPNDAWYTQAVRLMSELIKLEITLPTWANHLLMGSHLPQLAMRIRTSHNFFGLTLLCKC